MVDLRRYAKGKPCMIRLDGVCNFDPETTVLAHLRMPGISGMSIKSPDLIAAWACSNCHDAIDRRTHPEFMLSHVRLVHMEGIVRTQNELVRLKVVTW